MKKTISEKMQASQGGLPRRWSKRTNSNITLLPPLGTPADPPGRWREWTPINEVWRFSSQGMEEDGKVENGTGKDKKKSPAQL